MVVPTVTTGRVQEGKLNILIRGNGTVETRSEHLLALQRGLRVEKVQPTGSAVKQGDVILQYDKAYLQESIEKKQAEITKLELAVGQAQLTGEPPARVEASEGAARDVQLAEENYSKAWESYSSAERAWNEGTAQQQQILDAEIQAAETEKEAAMQQAQQTYNDLKQQTPKMPVLSDFTESSADYSWGISDGSDADDSDGEDSSSYGYDYSGSDGGTVTADTSALESALETASDELAELQSDLASEKAIAEADSTSLTKEEKEKLKVTDNLSELDAKSAEELVKEGKKGITAEFNGIISKADIKQGAAVTQGMELFTIENTDKASVDVTLSKYDYNTVKEGQSVEITLGDNTYQGTVTKMSHIAVQNEKGTPVISATVSIDNPDEDIFLGVDAKVKIYAASAKNVVTLPVEVVNIGKEGSFCYVIEDGLVTKRNITTGISSEDYVEITDGIKEGEEVIADLGDYTEGMEVQAVPEQTGEDADE